MDIVTGSRIISLQDPKNPRAKAVLILPQSAETMEAADIAHWEQIQSDRLCGVSNHDSTGGKRIKLLVDKCESHSS